MGEGGVFPFLFTACRSSGWESATQHLRQRHRRPALRWPKLGCGRRTGTGTDPRFRSPAHLRTTRRPFRIRIQPLKGNTTLQFNKLTPPEPQDILLPTHDKILQPESVGGRSLIHWRRSCSGSSRSRIMSSSPKPGSGNAWGIRASLTTKSMNSAWVWNQRVRFGENLIFYSVKNNGPV